MKQQKHEDKEPERMALEEVAYGNQHALNVLLDLLIAKGIVSEQEFRDKLDEMVTESPELDEVNINFTEPDEPEE